MKWMFSRKSKRSLVTQTSLEDDCDDYVAGLDALDSARYLEINQRAYDAIQY